MASFLIRHTSLQVPKGVCYGRRDFPLSDSFLDEAAGLRRLLPALDALYSSPQRRCQLLSEQLSCCLQAGRQLIFDDRLQEYSYGDWEGVRWDDIESHALAHWMENFVDTAPPGGETYQEMEKRVLLFFEKRICKEKTIAVITHGGVLCAYLGHLRGMQPVASLAARFPCGGLLKLTWIIKKAHIKPLNF